MVIKRKKNYGTMEKKTKVLYRKTMEFLFTKDKNMVDFQKLQDFDL